MKKLLLAFLIATPLLQGCVINRLITQDDRINYSQYVETTNKLNLDREKAGLQPIHVMTFDEWER